MDAKTLIVSFIEIEQQDRWNDQDRQYHGRIKLVDETGTEEVQLKLTRDECIMLVEAARATIAKIVLQRSSFMKSATVRPVYPPAIEDKSNA